MKVVYPQNIRPGLCQWEVSYPGIACLVVARQWSPLVWVPLSPSVFRWSWCYVSASAPPSLHIIRTMCGWIFQLFDSVFMWGCSRLKSCNLRLYFFLGCSQLISERGVYGLYTVCIWVSIVAHMSSLTWATSFRRAAIAASTARFGGSASMLSSSGAITSLGQGAWLRPSTWSFVLVSYFLHLRFPPLAFIFHMPAF